MKCKQTMVKAGLVPALPGNEDQGHALMGLVLRCWQVLRWPQGQMSLKAVVGLSALSPFSIGSLESEEDAGWRLGALRTEPGTV